MSVYQPFQPLKLAHTCLKLFKHKYHVGILFSLTKTGLRLANPSSLVAHHQNKGTPPSGIRIYQIDLEQPKLMGTALKKLGGYVCLENRESSLWTNHHVAFWQPDLPPPLPPERRRTTRQFARRSPPSPRSFSGPGALETDSPRPPHLTKRAKLWMPWKGSFAFL